MIMIIYKTTNLINNKIYIGQDKYNNPKYLGSGDLIKSAIKKYGKQHFLKEVLFICKDQCELDEKERYYISKFNSLNRQIGYNISVGGKDGTTLNRNLSVETRDKISNSRKGMIFSKEHKFNLSKAKRGIKLSEEHKSNLSKAKRGVPHGPMSSTIKNKISKTKKGKSASTETKEKMSIAHMGIKNHFYGKRHTDETLLKRRKPILQFTLDDVFIKEWCGINVAAKELMIRQSDISGVLSGRYKQTHGFKFKYKNENSTYNQK